MSDRPLISPVKADYSPTINITTTSSSWVQSPVTIIQRIPLISYDIQWTGTPTGTFYFEVSNSYSQRADGTVNNIGVWTVLPSTMFTGTYPVPSGSPGNGFIDLDITGAYAVRMGYTAVGGSGAFKIWICAKVM